MLNPNFSRIRNIIDVDQMQARRVTIVGVGGGANLARNLVRCGIGSIDLVDFDQVEDVNICRQEHMHDTIGKLKVDALTAELHRINPQIEVCCFPRDFCSFSDDEIDLHFGDTDVFVFCVDNLKANARGNEVALRLGKPSVWSGVYPRGGAGEIAFWTPELTSCFRCLCAARYKAVENGAVPNNAADSADVLSVQIIDGIAGMIVVGLLTLGVDNQYGRMIDRLIKTQRNFLQVKIDPDWNWKGRDIFREQLQIPADCPAYFSFVTIARCDPDHGEPPCPDCVKYLGRQPMSNSCSGAEVP